MMPAAPVLPGQPVLKAMCGCALGINVVLRMGGFVPYIYSVWLSSIVSLSVLLHIWLNRAA